MKPRFEGTEKKCIICHRVLPVEGNFYMAKKTKIYSARCKTCDGKDHRKRYSSSYKARATTLFNSAKSRSQHRNIPFSITKADIIRQYEKQDGKCYYSGRPLSPVAGDENVMSLDRENPSFGYTPDNIVICSWRVNSMKKDFPKDDFLNLCKDICHFSDNNKQ